MTPSLRLVLPGLPFLMVAIGQAMGAPVAGTLIEVAGPAFTFSIFAATAVVTMQAAYR